jgi:hypothetical protein
MEKSERIKQSKRNYGKKYNKINVSVQLNRNLIQRVKDEKTEVSIKLYIENLIEKSLV